MEAIEQFENSHVSLMVIKNGQVTTSEENGLKPVLQLLEKDPKAFEGAEVYDKVVGKAHALLMVLAKAGHVYGTVMSQEGIRILKEHGIPYAYGEECAHIINRERTGMCPMELTVQDIEDPEEALQALKLKVAQLQQQSRH